jgi:hypothetical protein
MIGMMWLDTNPKKAIEDKIRSAAAYYLKKYGEKSTLCFINPSQQDNLTEVDGIKILAVKHILTNCFWLISDHYTV